MMTNTLREKKRLLSFNTSAKFGKLALLYLNRQHIAELNVEAFTYLQVSEKATILYISSFQFGTAPHKLINACTQYSIPVPLARAVSRVS